MIGDLAAAIIRDGKVSSDWEQSFIVYISSRVRPGMHWTWQLSRSQIDRAGHESPGED